MKFTKSPIKDLYDKRRVVYWLWLADGKQLGAVSPKPEGFRALIYRENENGGRITELGMHDTKAQAEKAVKTWGLENPERVRKEAVT